MTQEEIILNGNKLIDVFIDNWLIGKGFSEEELNYNSDWGTLMPVVEKIESIYDDYHGYFAVYIGGNSCTIQGTRLRVTGPKPVYAYYTQEIQVDKITATYYAVVRFINWYNINIKPHEN